MNETNGLGAVVPVGWMRTIAGLYPGPSIYTTAVLERGTPILPGEADETCWYWHAPTGKWCRCSRGGSHLRNRQWWAWLRPHAAPSPQPVPGSDAESRLNEYFARIESRESDPLVLAAPPQESDKGRGCGQAYHDERGEVQDCEEGALCRRCLERQLAEARDELQTARNALAARPAPADVVTVPMLMDELYALEVRKGFYTQMVTIHLDLLVSIRRTYEYFAETHLGLSGDIARIDDALRSSAKGGKDGG